MLLHPSTAVRTWILGLLVLLTVLPVQSQGLHAQDELPMLMIDANELPTLRAQRTTTHADIWSQIERFAQRQSTIAPQQGYYAGMSENQLRLAGDILIPLAFACVIETTPDYCDPARNYLLTYARWGQWHRDGRRDLGLAHMLQANALAYTWLYDTLTPEEQTLVRTTLMREAEKMYRASSEPLRGDWNNWWGGSFMQNHYTTNNSALGMAGLATHLRPGSEADREIASDWIFHAADRIGNYQALADGIGDGSWHEGINYQNYGITLSLPYMTELNRVMGVDVIPDTYLQAYVDWRLYNYRPGSNVPLMPYANYQYDWGTSYQPQNILRFIAAEYEDGEAEWLAQELIGAGGRFANEWATPWVVFEYLYYNPAIAPIPPSATQGGQLTLSDAQGVIWRTGWEPGNIAFGMMASAYGGRNAFDVFTQQSGPWTNGYCPCALNVGHNHADAGNFSITYGDDLLAVEVVGFNGNFRETQLHNTLLIDGQGQSIPDNSQYGTVEVYQGTDPFMEASISTPNFNYAAVDVTRPYTSIEDLEDFTRHVVFVRPSYFVMVDNLEAASAHRYTWQVGTVGSYEWSSPRLALTSDDGNAMDVITNSDVSFRWQQYPSGVMASLETRTASEDHQFAHLLYPVPHPDARPEFVTENRADGVLVGTVTVDGQRDVLLFRTETQPAPSALFDGTAAVIRYDAEGNLTHLFADGGRYLNNPSDDRPLLAGFISGDGVEIGYEGAEVRIFGDIRTETRIRLYAPGVESLTVNGQATPFQVDGDYAVFTP